MGHWALVLSVVVGAASRREVLGIGHWAEEALGEKLISPAPLSPLSLSHLLCFFKGDITDKNWGYFKERTLIVLLTTYRVSLQGGDTYSGFHLCLLICYPCRNVAVQSFYWF